MEELVSEATSINEAAMQLMKFHGSYMQARVREGGGKVGLRVCACVGGVKPRLVCVRDIVTGREHGLNNEAALQLMKFHGSYMQVTGGEGGGGKAALWLISRPVWLSMIFTPPLFSPRFFPHPLPGRTSRMPGTNVMLTPPLTSFFSHLPLLGYHFQDNRELRQPGKPKHCLPPPFLPSLLFPRPSLQKCLPGLP